MGRHPFTIDLAFMTAYNPPPSILSESRLQVYQYPGAYTHKAPQVATLATPTCTPVAPALRARRQRRRAAPSTLSVGVVAITSTCGPGPGPDAFHDTSTSSDAWGSREGLRPQALTSLILLTQLLSNRFLQQPEHRHDNRPTPEGHGIHDTHATETRNATR